MSEFQIIQDCFADIGQQKEVVLGVGDDAAVVKAPANCELVFATDTLLENVHFPKETIPENIAYKALAVNLSDMAAMGARPLWFLLSLTIPQESIAENVDWLTRFSQSLAQLADEHKIQLIGGDTTSGPLNINLQMIGAVPTGKAILRSGAQVGDLVYVTGSIGDAGLGLQYKQDPEHSSKIAVSSPLTAKNDVEYLLARLERPDPRVKQGMELLGMANAMIDISDGLLADLSHILAASQKGAEVQLEKIPIHQDNEVKHILAAVNAGDDYELCFTIPAEKSGKLEQLSRNWACQVTQIGEIVQNPGLRCYLNKVAIDVTVKGYDHFQ